MNNQPQGNVEDVQYELKGTSQEDAYLADRLVDQVTPRTESIPPHVSGEMFGELNVAETERESHMMFSSLPNDTSDVPIPRKLRDVDNIKSILSGVETTNHVEYSSSRTRMDANTDDFHRLYTSNPTIRLVSEKPFVMKFNVRGMSLPKERLTIKRSRSNAAAASTYRELDDSDSDDLMSDDEHQKLLVKRLKKKSGQRSTKSQTLIISPSSKSKIDHSIVPAPVLNDPISAATSFNAFIPDASAMDAVAAPPPGELNTLWYSRECFNHVWVMEKICGWKKRPVFSSAALKKGDEDGDNVPVTESSILDLNTAVKIQQAILQTYEFTTDTSRRVEVSRINPQQCPLIRTMATTAKSSALPLQATAGGPVSETKTSHAETEEVLLVKWRGRSHYHCSWERPSDIERLDQSGNSTAKNKIRRYYQQQETLYGLHWRQLLDEERKTAASILHNSSEELTFSEQNPERNHGGDQIEEFFSPQCLMVERILGCDENEMDMKVFAKQRAINMQKERMEDEKKEELGKHLQSDCIEANGTISIRALLAADDWEVPFDPEDNVRYVVKWKDLPYADITWEYWRDIKHDAVDEAEDFWYRQIPPDLEYAKQCFNRPHPHMRDFKKLQASHSYGVSKKPRPVANLNGKKKENESIELNSTTESESGFRLRSYQLEGLNWLLFNWWNRRSCILADEMGLGYVSCATIFVPFHWSYVSYCSPFLCTLTFLARYVSLYNDVCLNVYVSMYILRCYLQTIQSAAFLQELQSQTAAQIRGPFLIVAPLSLIDQWQSELRSWAPDMNVILYHGSADARDFLVKHEFYFTDQFVPKADAAKLKKFQVTKFHVLITTYEVVLKDIAVLSKIRWKTLIVDEAHRLKNYKARLFLELSTFPRDHCVLLTGTPIANATEELWALLNFANPQIFYDRDDFLAKFGEMTDAQQVNELHALLKPYLLRRVKEDVEKSLPNKEETILEVSLTPIQKTFYKAIYERNTSFLFKGAKSNNAPSLMNVMMELRKCCNHPFLIKGAEERILNEASLKARAKESEASGNEWLDQSQIYAEQLVKSSGKMVLMEKLLHKLFDGGHKVLIFSQMVRVLDLLEDLLRIKKYRYERLDGSTSSSSRLHAVERFKKKECNRFVMLLSTRAGGLGLNLTVADIVIIFDSDWNPQNDMQGKFCILECLYASFAKINKNTHASNSVDMQQWLGRIESAKQKQSKSIGTLQSNYSLSSCN